jgi:hypothetical protein
MKLHFKKVLAVGISMLLSVSAASPAFAGEWKHLDGGEFWQNWYQEDDGSYPVSTWKEIDGKQYHFDSEGYIDVGWKFYGDNWYFLQNDGAMSVNQTFEGGYTNEYGIWVSDPVPPNNSWVTTEEEDAYWAGKMAEYGLNYSSFVDQGDGSYVLTTSYNNDTVFPDLINTIHTLAAFSFQGFQWNWNSQNGIITFTVVPEGFY